MNKTQYAEYEAEVAAFFEKEGLNCLTPAGYPEGCIEPHFSWRWCDVCSRPEAGDRLDAAGYNPTTGEIQNGYSVCEDCIYYAEHGCLDDATLHENPPYSKGVSP